MFPRLGGVGGRVGVLEPLNGLDEARALVRTSASAGGCRLQRVRMPDAGDGLEVVDRRRISQREADVGQ